MFHSKLLVYQRLRKLDFSLKSPSSNPLFLSLALGRAQQPEEMGNMLRHCIHIWIYRIRIITVYNNMIYISYCSIS